MNENFDEIYKDGDLIELTQSFKISTLTTVEKIKSEAADYWGVNGARYELYYLKKKKLEDSKESSYTYKSLVEWKDWTMNKCLDNLKLKEARFHLLKKRNEIEMQGPNRIEAKEAVTEVKAKKLSVQTNLNELEEREKILCMYHGLNVICF